MNYCEIEKLVRAFFADRSRTPAETREGLELLKEEIEIMIECLSNIDKLGGGE